MSSDEDGSWTSSASLVTRKKMKEAATAYFDNALRKRDIPWDPLEYHPRLSTTAMQVYERLRKTSESTNKNEGIAFLAEVCTASHDPRRSLDSYTKIVLEMLEQNHWDYIVYVLMFAVEVAARNHMESSRELIREFAVSCVADEGFLFKMSR